MKRYRKPLRDVKEGLKEVSAHNNEKLEDLPTYDEQIEAMADTNPKISIDNLPGFYRVAFNGFYTYFLFTCLRPTQLFNVEKRFGMVVEELDTITRNREDKISLSTTDKAKITFVMIVNDPKRFLIRGYLEQQKPSKPTGWESIFTNLRNLKELAELTIQVSSEIQEPSDKQPEEMSVHDEFKSLGIRLPKKIPKRMLEPLRDFIYARSQREILRSLVDKLCSEIWELMQIWAKSGLEIWRWVKHHRHNIPILCNYEFQRASLRAMSIVYCNALSKVHKFFKSRKGTRFVRFLADHPEIASDLKLDEDWDSGKREATSLQVCRLSVEEMMMQLQRTVAADGNPIRPCE